MPVWFIKLFPQPIKRRNIFLESLLFVLAVLLLLFVLPEGSSGRILVENTAILTASATSAILIFLALPSMPVSSRRSWFVLGLSVLAWLVSSFLLDFIESLVGDVGTVSLVGDILSVLAYLLSAAALLLYPFRSRHAPTRFRFLLDAIISAGVVISLGFLLLVRPASAGSSLPDALVMASSPIADGVLLVLLANVSMANWVPRSTARFLAAAWGAILISDYLHSSLMAIGSYHPGSPISLGWICGFLLIGIAAMFEKERTAAQETPGLDMGVQFQKVLPIALVLGLFWYVVADGSLSGQLSPYGLWMSVILGIMLIVRLGIRAGEAELNQYWQLFRNLATPGFISDSKGIILLANPACGALRAMTEQADVRGRSLFDLFDGPLPADLERAARQDRAVQATLKGRGTPYLLSLSPIISENRRTLIAGIAHDLSEQERQRARIQSAYDELKRVHGALEDLNAQLEQKVAERTGTLEAAYRQLEEQNRLLQGLDQIKSDFVSMVSHELRAPLTNLSGGLELLMSRAHSSTDEKTLLLIQAEIKRLTRFVESILNLSALEAGRLMLHPVGLSLPLVAGEARNGWSNLSEFDRVELDMDENLPLVLADENALRSVFGHLIDNALKYAPGSVVQIQAHLVDGSMRVSVRDFGPGIPLDKEGLLFERFQRLEARDSQAVYGYGLGLYLSRQLLRAMDSELCFERPAGGGGAVFYFTLALAV